MRSYAVRFSIILVLVGALFGLCGFYGTLEPTPKYHNYPDEDELATSYDDYVDQEVALSGTVVATEPVILAVAHDIGTAAYEIRNAPDADVGQELWLFATVRSDGTLEAHTTIGRESWERTSMDGISIVAALWIVARALKLWRFDSSTDRWPALVAVLWATIVWAVDRRRTIPSTTDNASTDALEHRPRYRCVSTPRLGRISGDGETGLRR